MKSKPQRLPTHDHDEDDNDDRPQLEDEAPSSPPLRTTPLPAQKALEAGSVEIELSEILAASPTVGSAINPIAPKLAVDTEDNIGLSLGSPMNSNLYSPSSIDIEVEESESTDPCVEVCEQYIQFPKIGHQYVVYSKKQTECIVGPHWTGLTYTASLIIGATTAYLIQQAPTLPIYCTYIALLMATISLTCLFLTGCSDPGIVRTDVGPPTSGPARFCEQCQVHMPPKAYHCDDCNCCIEELDHHCPWMGKCIGKKNMFWFQSFNISWIAYAVFALGAKDNPHVILVSTTQHPS